jgi:hypothetical protein
MKTYLPIAEGEIMTMDHTRPTYVPEQLSDLHGPIQGTVTLPLILDWTPANTYDLSSQNTLRRLYETVLSEAVSENDVNTFVEENALKSLWPQLRLPRRVRYAWETIHPELIA